MIFRVLTKNSSSMFEEHKQNKIGKESMIQEISTFWFLTNYAIWLDDHKYLFSG